VLGDSTDITYSQSAQQLLARFAVMIPEKLWRGHARLRLPPANPVLCPQSAPQLLARLASMISAKLRRGHALSAEHEFGAQASRVDRVACAKKTKGTREGSTERCALTQPRLPLRSPAALREERFDHPASGGSSSADPAVAFLIIQLPADPFGGSSARTDAVDMHRMQKADPNQRLLQDRRLPKVSL